MRGLDIDVRHSSTERSHEIYEYVTRTVHHHIDDLVELVVDPEKARAELQARRRKSASNLSGSKIGEHRVSTFDDTVRNSGIGEESDEGEEEEGGENIVSLSGEMEEKDNGGSGSITKKRNKFEEEWKENEEDEECEVKDVK